MELLEFKLPVVLGQQRSHAKFMHHAGPNWHAENFSTGEGPHNVLGSTIPEHLAHPTAGVVISIHGQNVLIVTSKEGTSAAEDMRNAPYFLQKKIRLQFASIERQLRKNLHEELISLTDVETFRFTDVIQIVRDRILERFAGQTIFESDEPYRPTKDQFIPSDKLASYVASAMARMKADQRLQEALLSGEKAKPELLLKFVSEADRSNDHEHQFIELARQMISQNVKLVMSGIGVRVSEGKQSDVTMNITYEGRFADFLVQGFLEALPVDIYQAKPFLDQLYSELLPVGRSGAYGGNWGKLIVVGDELALRINPRRTKQDRKWTRAKVFKRRKS